MQIKRSSLWVDGVYCTAPDSMPQQTIKRALDLEVTARRVKKVDVERFAIRADGTTLLKMKQRNCVPGICETCQNMRWVVGKKGFRCREYGLLQYGRESCDEYSKQVEKPKVVEAVEVAKPKVKADMLAWCD